jgi:WD repeat and FYVE domain-containing protein 3
VEKYSDPRSDPHCVRLLTLVRNINNSRDEHLVCLTVVLSARDKAIIVSTQETLVPHSEYNANMFQLYVKHKIKGKTKFLFF